MSIKQYGSILMNLYVKKDIFYLEKKLEKCFEKTVF